MTESYSSLVGRYGSQRAAAKAIGVPKTTFQNRLKRETLDPVMKTAMDAKNSQLIPSNLWTRGIDDDGNRFTAHFRPEKLQEENEILEAVKDALSDVKPSKLTAAPKGTVDDLITVYPVVDLHLGMQSWAKETGKDYNTKIACQRLKEAMNNLIVSAPKSETALVLNLGDLTHANDDTNQTQSGHILDVDSRIYKTIFTAVDLMVTVIELAKQRHAKVVYRGLRGNHDRSIHIAVTCGLSNRYQADPRVEVIADPSDFFFYQFGKVMIAAHHGDKARAERLVLHAADTEAKMFGSTIHRHYLTGHIHHDSSKDIGGFKHESFRTLAPKDSWSHGMAYSSRQSMVAISYHKDQGEFQRITVNY